MQLLEAALHQGEEIAAVGTVYDQRRASIAPAGGRQKREHGDDDETSAECGVRNAEWKWEVEPRHESSPDIPHSAFRLPHSYRLRSASRFANSRYAPGTPAGSCRK